MNSSDLEKRKEGRSSLLAPVVEPVQIAWWRSGRVTGTEDLYREVDSEVHDVLSCYIAYHATGLVGQRTWRES